MLQQFNNMNEVTVYLHDVEDRLRMLEAENEKLRTSQPGAGNMDGNAIARYVSSRLPVTNLLNPSFLKRAFTVWGHFFIANLIIAIVVGIAYACFVLVLFGAFFQSSR
jgi:hypothetical protein